MYHEESETIMSPKITGLNPSQGENAKLLSLKESRLLNIKI